MLFAMKPFFADVANPNSQIRHCEALFAEANPNSIPIFLAAVYSAFFHSERSEESSININCRLSLSELSALNL
jgi:hypothetical protein